ncbi:barren, partial [Dendrothele bispora CBS 962.96]
MSRSQPLYDDDDEYVTELEQSPRRQRSGVRKRLSEAYLPANDASFVSDSGARAINDDAAEKRKRRKSTKFVTIDNAQASSSNEAVEADTSKMKKQKTQLKTVEAPLPESKEVMSLNYEEWMKLATDNKINATNTWNFALIDYFHDMSLLRNTDDNSINFQRASHTLDGCVKIWTSRVDSVGTETAKLANNLASGGSVDDDDDAGSDNPDDDQIKEKKKKTHRSNATLVKDPSQLRTKKLDLEFSVDPLFRKTCADFDEGGAQGLLMNHLSLGVGQDGGLRVVFDASDSVAKAEDEEVVEEPEDLIDLSLLRKDFLPDLGVLEDLAICPSLEDFSFSNNNFHDDTTFFQDDTQVDDDEDDSNDFGANHDMAMDNDDHPVEDFFVGDDAVVDDYAGGGFDMIGGDDDNSSTGAGPSGEVAVGEPGSFVPFDPRRIPDQRDLILAMTDENSGGTLDYFGEDFIRKNWAGPEHWKMRKTIRRPETDTAEKKTRREKKEPNRIDFLAPRDPEKSLDDISKELFAPPGKGASINLAGSNVGKKSKRKTKIKEKRDDHRLPDDMHFSSKQLVTLFLKPKFALKMRGRRLQNGEDVNGEVDANFWAQAAADQAAGRARGEDGDETADGGAIPFNTQFFHDDYDDGPGFDDPYDGEGVGAVAVDDEQDILTSSLGQSRRVKPEFVKYAKRAKRVDVRKLKENIWKGLDIKVPIKKSNDEEDSMSAQDVDEDDGHTPTEPTEGRTFSSVISNLQNSYPQDKMQEISTSFCFICLLHLANEQGLKLQNETAAIDDDDEYADTKIGDIWNLKVYRDPSATAA